MAIKTFTAGSVLTAADTNTYLANSGLVYVTSANITSGTAVTITNAFSATYDNYRLVFTSLLASTPDGGYYITLGNSATGSNYYEGGYYINLGSSAMSVLVRNNNTSILFGTASSSIYFSTAFDVCTPYLAQPTNFPALMAYGETGFIGSAAGRHNSNTSYTSFTISNAGGTFSSGRVDVYGYRKA